MKRPVISAWRESPSGLLEPGWYATDDEVPRQGPCETKLEAENRVRELRGQEPAGSRRLAAARRRAEEGGPRPRPAAPRGTVAVPCKACSVCGGAFKVGEAVVIRGKRCLCMPDAMHSGSSSGLVVEYLGDGRGR